MLIFVETCADSEVWFSSYIFIWINIELYYLLMNQNRTRYIYNMTTFHSFQISTRILHFKAVRIWIVPYPQIYWVHISQKEWQERRKAVLHLLECPILSHMTSERLLLSLVGGSLRHIWICPVIGHFLPVGKHSFLPQPHRHTSVLPEDFKQNNYIVRLYYYHIINMFEIYIAPHQENLLWGTVQLKYRCWIDKIEKILASIFKKYKNKKSLKHVKE